MTNALRMYKYTTVTDLVCGSYSKNPASNIDAQQKEPTYEVIPSDTDRTPHTTQNLACQQNPAYVHLSVHSDIQENIQTDKPSPWLCDYAQNPAYGVHSNPNNNY